MFVIMYSRALSPFLQLSSKMVALTLILLYFATGFGQCQPCFNGSIQLVSSASGNSYGAVEVCIGGEWGSICGDYWDNSDASVVCRQLGYSPYGAIASSKTHISSNASSHHITDLNCAGDEVHVLNCARNSLNNYTCPLNRDAIVFCQLLESVTHSNCSDGDVRLIGGATEYEGRVELCVNKAWGTICAYNGWTSVAAKIVCTQIGALPAGYNQGRVGSLGFSIGNGAILLGYLSCMGDETNLLNCNPNYYQTNVVSYCQTHYYDAGVTCEPPCENGTIRLSDGSNTYGRVEVCISESWRTVCGSHWNYKSSSVVCRQLGFSPYGATPLKNYYSNYLWSHGIIHVNCSSFEDSLLNCSYVEVINSTFNCSDNYDAGVICQTKAFQAVDCVTGDIRLIGGTVANEGRLEVCLNRVWGTVCGLSWGSANSKVVCRQLGHQELGPSNYGYRLYGQGSGPVVYGFVSCNGTEQSLSDCSRNVSSVAVGLCTSHFYDIGLTCEPRCANGIIRLQEGTLTSNGRVEVCFNGTWGTICSDFWNNNDASIVCKQLGYSPYGAIASSGLYSDFIWPHHIIDLNCTGTESSIWNCPHNGLSHYSCSNSHDALVACQSINTPRADCIDGEVRLVNGATEYEGRVEICLNRAWGTVCSNRYWSWWRYSYSWSTLNTNTVCTHVGHMKIGSTYSQFGQGSGPILLSSVHCSGQNSHLLDCSYSVFIPSYCSHSADVGIICEALCENGTVRMYSSSGSYFRRYGRVQVCVNNVWGTICDDYWDDNDAAVVCRMLGYSSNGYSALKNTLTEGTWYVHINDLNCTGNELSLWDCPMNQITGYSCDHRDDSAIICQLPDLIYSNCTNNDVRLMNGKTEYEGRLEVCINGVWGSICDKSWSSYSAYTVCQQLGFQGGKALSNSYFGVSSNRILIYRLICNSIYSNISYCNQIKTPLTICSNFHEAGVRCEEFCPHGKVELYGGPSSQHGIVRVCADGKWVKLCAFGSTVLNNDLATVICTSLGFSSYGAKVVTNIWGDNYHYPYLFHNMHCIGNETSLFDCHYDVTGTCSFSWTVSAFCQRANINPANCTDGDVRLYGGPVPNHGTLHVCANGAWGTVCKNGHWTDVETDVVCFQLGYYNRLNTYAGKKTTDNYPIIFAEFNCYRSAIDLLSCGSGLSQNLQYCTNNAVEIKCEKKCRSGSIQLVGRYYYGRVELCVEGRWGAVCGDDFWDNVDASVVCRELGFSPYGASAFTGYWNYRRERYISLIGLNCSGTENHIEDCPVNSYSSHCPVGADAKVLCPVHGSEYSNCTDGEIKLFGGKTEYEGTVEICINNAWGTVVYYRTYYSQSYIFAQTVCNAIGYTAPGAVYYSSARFGKGNGPILLTVYCNSIKNSLLDCNAIDYMATFHHQYDAGVRCQSFCKTGDVRIVGTTDPLVGRVEVCVDETWGTVCDDYWHNDDARVVCRQLGFSGNEAMALTGLYTDYQKLFHIIDLNCNGTENSVFNCSHNTIEEYSCLDYEDAYVQCSVFNASDNCSNGDIRLTGGPSQYEGIVEVCYERVWGSICPPAWSRADAQVTCRQLGYTTIGAATSNIYGKSAGPIHFSNFYCSSSENFLLNCSHGTSSCYNYDNHAGVKCEAPCVDGDIRLKGNVKFHNFGRVEICVNGTWGTVCDNEWDNTDARVVCEQLGYSPYGALARHSYFFERQLPHKLFNVNCTGDEDALLDCSYQTSGSTCSQSDDSGVICQVRDVTPSNCTDYDVRLVDGEFHNEGKVEICLNDIWGTFCNSLDANMICQEVGYSNGGEVYNAQSPSAGIDDVILVGGMSCAQSATSIDQCSFSLYNSAFTCDVRDIIAIRCHNCSNGSIRLIDYNARAEKLGRVEVCVNGEWGGICSQFFTDIDAKVVCRHLGYSELGSVSLGNLYSDFDVPLHVMNLNCTGSEEVIWDCPSSVQGQELCSIWKDVSVYCYDYDAEYSDCFNGQLRLSNGSATLQGRLEMCYSNAWFGLYAGDFHNYFKGATACNGLGYSNGMNIGYSSSFLDLPYIPVFPLQYSCNSVRNSFLDCSSSPLLYYNSYTYLFFGVTCPEKCTTGDVQLSGSDYDNMGRVEVCINGTWGTICSSSFDFNDAIVVCSHLGYLSYGVMIISSTNRYVSFYYPVFIYDLNCTGSENNLWDCPYNDTVRYCSTYSDAAIICQRDNSTVNKSCVTGEIQLVGGTNEYEGRVEICYNQMWGTVCDNSWDTVDSNVVCSQLGHQPFGSNPLYGSYFGDGHSPFMLSNVACSSNIEQANARLIDCGYSAPKAVLSCGDGESASVVCLEACTNGDVKLSGSSFENSGLLEVCIERLWTTVCDKTWDFNDAAVACKQLGFSSYGAMPLYNCYTEGQLSFGITNISCNGSEEQIFGCSYSNSITNCMQHNDAGIMCQDAGVKSNCTSGDIRLTASYEGRVEICVNEAWGTICSAGWSNTDANVVCKQLGYLPIGGRAITNGQYGPGVGPILMANIDCIGSEKTLLDCSHRSCEVTSCSHFNDAGVFCERNCTNGNIRLGDGAELRGRVEVCIMNVWSTICASHWTVIEATVICSQLGYSPYGAQAVTGVFIDYEWSIGIYELHCTGNESTIWDCIYQISNTGQQCSQSTDASVFCMPNSTQYINCSDGDIRLIGGDVMNEGNVQICYNQVWGSVCDDYWGSDDSDVVCYQLGLQPFGSQAYGNNYFRVANNPWFVLGRFFCSGSEESLIECPRQSTSSLLQCESYEIAGVHCIGSCTHGSIRLRGSTNPYAGEVEVCIRGVWSNICGEEWDIIDATIVCRQLGLPTHGSLGLHGSLIPSIYPMRLYDTRCIGNEHSILLCSIQQTERGLSYEQCLSNKAIAFCQSPDTPYSDCMTGEVRLIGGINLLEGRVEICFNNIWGTICDHGWTFEDSNVVCHSLGHQAFGSVPMFSSIFGTSDLPIILTNLQCGGHENNLFQCQSNLANLLQCTHNELAGVKCEALCTNGDIRIVGDTSNPPSYGRVDFCVNQTWGTICDSSWTESEASVVCRQKGFSPYGAIPVSNGPQNTLIPTNADVVKCSGDENSLNDCTVTYGGQISMCVATADAGVICQNNDVHFSDCSTGDLRLVGPKPHEGRVEVCINKIWGAVCDDFWSITDANVACDQLGYYPSGAMPRYGSYYTGQGSLPSLISGLRCTGSESRLLDCTYDTSYAAVRHCGHFNQAGVKCHGSFPVYICDNDKLPHGDIFGGELVCISGPFFNQDDDISCKFGEIYTTCQYISREKCVCIAPEQHFDGIIILEIIIRRPGEPVMYGATNYRYTVPNICHHINFDVGEIINLIHNVGEVTKFSWNPKDLDLSKSAVDDAVDITMQAYDLTRNVWENDIVLKEGVPNSGETDITIPDLVRAAKNGVSLIRINVKLKSLDFKRGSLLRMFKSSLKFAVKLKKSIYQRVACEAWHKSIPGVDANDLPPCPCNLEQMNGDLERYTKESALQFCFSKLFFKKPKAHSCYRQSNVGKFSSSQQCCYDEQSNLITGIGGGAPYSVYPNNWKSFIGHVVSDIIPFYACCYGTFKSCNRYYDRRPNDDCRDWPRRPPPRRFFGDPHMTTLDGLSFTFNGHGEFTMIESLDKFITMQVRLVEPLVFNNDSNMTLAGSGTVISAVAARQIDSDTVQFEITDGELKALVNGDITDFSSLTEHQYQNVTINKIDNETLIATFSAGLSITARERGGTLYLSVFLLDDYYNKTRGLLGQFNGEKGDDLIPKNSSHYLPENSSMERIHKEFGLTWIVNRYNESLFTYGPSGSWKTFYKPDYIPLFETKFSDQELEDEALELCGDDKQCLFDVAATGDLNIGEITRDIGEELAILQDNFQPTICNPPCVNGACVHNNTCSCSEGYNGTYCNSTILYECEENICLNGGNCYVLAGDYVCTCQEGYEGIDCSTALNPTDGSPSNLQVVGIIMLVVLVLLFGFVIIIATAIYCKAGMKKETTAGNPIKFYHESDLATDNESEISNPVRINPIYLYDGQLLESDDEEEVDL